MSTVQIHKLNEATLRIVSEDSGALRGDSWEHFTFEVEGARINYAHGTEQKLWDGKVQVSWMAEPAHFHMDCY